MKTSQNGINLIKQFEGLRLEAYKCPGGVLTIGYGHTGDDVKEGDRITPDNAEYLLKQDIKSAEYCINTEVKRELTQNQYDALISFVFNIGSFNFRHSTLLRQLNYGNYQKAAEQFDKWIYSKKTILPGLVKRRKAERLLFERPAFCAEMKEYLAD